MSAEVDIARALAAQGRVDDAKAIYAKLLNTAKPPLEAYSFMAMLAFKQRKFDDAVKHLKAALKQEPAHSRFLTDLGMVYRAQNKLDYAAEQFVQACRMAPENFMARLYLGTVCERQGKADEALRHYVAAIDGAREQGQWLKPEATPPEAKQAMVYVKTGQAKVFGALLDELKARFDGGDLKRVVKFMDAYMGNIAADAPAPLQRPIYFFFPDLPVQHYFTRDDVPWVADLEAQTAVIREEALHAVSDGNLPSFLKRDRSTGDETYLGGTETSSWDAFFFYRDGLRVEDNHLRAPRTSATIEQLPLVRIKHSAPEICFSVLTPGTEIKPHTGVANVRMVVHLPLIVPDNCAIMVAGEERAWVEGTCVMFDDTYEHAAWNRSADYIRIVLLMDAWNPHLTLQEREAVTVLINGIGDFNRSVLAPL
jgi:aspartate beta-hydroxylase